MPVARGQIEEIYEALHKYLSDEELRMLLKDLRKTQAYISNNSFAQTLERVQEFMG